MKPVINLKPKKKWPVMISHVSTCAVSYYPNKAVFFKTLLADLAQGRVGEKAAGTFKQSMK